MLRWSHHLPTLCSPTTLPHSFLSRNWLDYSWEQKKESYPLLLNFIFSIILYLCIICTESSNNLYKMPHIIFCATKKCRTKLWVIFLPHVDFLRSDCSFMVPQRSSLCIYLTLVLAMFDRDGFIQTCSSTLHAFSS